MLEMCLKERTIGPLKIPRVKEGSIYFLIKTKKVYTPTYLEDC